ncbi:MAG: ABC transporter ATP-binding protein [Treponema sp.]|nr:ABC transporter ATP-binding protein [Treponema sp.]
MITVNHLCAGYDGADVIHDISFGAAAGEMLCVLGPNGCGKSTLLKAIARIINYRGNVLLHNIDSATMPRKALAQKIAFLGQVSQVYFPYTVYETIAMGRYAYAKGFLKNLSAEDTAIINSIITQLAIEDIQDRLIDEISGGQLQRVFLARTLAQTPDIILLDEPTNHLDLKHQMALLTFLKSYAQEHRKTIIGVFHDLNLARHFGDTAIALHNGTIAAHGTITDVLHNDILQTVYDIDIRAFMRESLGKWGGNNEE